MTRHVALLGRPLRRRHSQVMHDAAFAAAGIDARYELLELEPGEVEAAVEAARGPGWLGLGVTAPYKRVVAGLCDEVEHDATLIGAVNNVVRTVDGRLVGLQLRRAGVPGGRGARDGPAARGRWTWSLPAPAEPRTRSCTRASPRGPAVSSSATARPPPPACSRSASRPTGGGHRVCRGPGRPRVRRVPCAPRTWRSTRRRWACWSRAPRSTSTRCRTRRPCSTSCTCRPRPRCSAPPAPAACGPPTAPRCSSHRPPSRSSAGPGSPGMADVMRAAVAPLLADTGAGA